MICMMYIERCPEIAQSINSCRQIITTPPHLHDPSRTFTCSGPLPPTRAVNGWDQPALELRHRCQHRIGVTKIWVSRWSSRVKELGQNMCNMWSLGNAGNGQSSEACWTDQPKGLPRISRVKGKPFGPSKALWPCSDSLYELISNIRVPCPEEMQFVALPPLRNPHVRGKLHVEFLLREPPS